MPNQVKNIVTIEAENDEAEEEMQPCSNLEQGYRFENIMRKWTGSIFVTRKKYDTLLKNYQDVISSLKNIKREYSDLFEQEQKTKIAAEKLFNSYSGFMTQQLTSLLEILTQENAEFIYDKLSLLDFDGRVLWLTCHDLLQIHPSDYFYAENVMGYFEGASYHSLVEWAEIAKFHEIKYRYSDCYEFYESSVLDENLRSAYDDYKANLHMITVEKIIRDFTNMHKYYIEQEVSLGRHGCIALDFYDRVNKIWLEFPTIYAQADSLKNLKEGDRGNSEYQEVMSEKYFDTCTEEDDEEIEL